MNINDLISIVKDKLTKKLKIEYIKIEDKSFLHKKHSGHEKGKYHLKLSINSKELKQLNRIESNKKIYKILQDEMTHHIHSLQILIN